jgi:hypothetical protein
VLLVIDEGRRTSVIILRLGFVNLRSGGRRRFEGARLLEVERRSHGERGFRRFAGRGSSLLVLHVL